MPEVVENVTDVAEIAQDVKDVPVNGWAVIAGITSAIALGEAVYFVGVPKIKELAKNLKAKKQKSKDSKQEAGPNTEE